MHDSLSIEIRILQETFPTIQFNWKCVKCTVQSKNALVVVYLLLDVMMNRKEVDLICLFWIPLFSDGV
jgi:hypothetical protein